MSPLNDDMYGSKYRPMPPVDTGRGSTLRVVQGTNKPDRLRRGQRGSKVMTPFGEIKQAPKDTAFERIKKGLEPASNQGSEGELLEIDNDSALDQALENSREAIELFEEGYISQEELTEYIELQDEEYLGSSSNIIC